jgi:endonuclease/exonuclease/phosphatase family metal-dependent hydrolase
MRTIRIVTFNIAHARGLSPIPRICSERKARANLQKIARLLVRLDADIVALQEIDENSRWNGSFNHLEVLREQAGFPHAVFGINNRRAGRFNYSYGNAILSRHPIVTSENLTFGQARVGEKGCLFTEIDVAGRLLPFVNLHLHYGSRARRFLQIDQVMAYLDEKHLQRRSAWQVPPILCGDLNNPSHKPDATASLLGYFSRHGHYTLHPLLGARTFPSAWPSRSLDFVFLPPACHAPSSRVVRSLLSDHCPVLVEFALP